MGWSMLPAVKRCSEVRPEIDSESELFGSNVPVLCCVELVVSLSGTCCVNVVECVEGDGQLAYFW